MPLSTYDEAPTRRQVSVSTEDPVEQAVAEFQSGTDREGNFRTIVDAYYRPVKGFFAKRVFSAEDGLELTQETFLCIYRGLDGFRREARFRSWIFAIAHTTYLKWLERRKRRDSLAETSMARREAQPRGAYDDGEPVAVSEHTPLEKVLRDEASEKLAEAVHELPDQERRCVTLRVYHDLSHAEIAGVLGLKVGTVKAHLHHARQKLRSALRETLGGIDF